MQGVIEQIKKKFWAFVGWVFFLGIIGFFLGFLLFLYWINHVRFVL